MTRILIVDDDPDMAELLGHMTDILGFTHEYAANGEQAVDACTQRPPDAIVLDVMLEDTDGWAVYKQLQLVTKAPIIFITAWRTGENRVKANELRADGFLAKPISHQDFAHQLNEVLGKPARRFSPAPETAPTPAPAAPPSSSAPPTGPAPKPPKQTAAS